jgi:hypothetical protein
MRFTKVAFWDILKPVISGMRSGALYIPHLPKCGIPMAQIAKRTATASKTLQIHRIEVSGRDSLISRNRTMAMSKTMRRDMAFY